MWLGEWMEGEVKKAKMDNDENDSDSEPVHVCTGIPI